jgi:glycosyltransferase involved in cell wall biosynthesis
MKMSLRDDSQPFVSILTPVYNAEKYLAECIESVLGQTYSNWEYVIVNNKSSDRSLEIAESYAVQDRRIRIVTNEKHLKQMKNLNQSFNFISRNSKYCKVIHADDWLFPECIAAMVAIAESYPSVGIVGSYRLDETNVDLDGLPYPSHCTDGRKIAREYFRGTRYLFGSPSSLLIRSDLILRREKFYDESALYGDTLACLDILRESDFGFVHQVLTFTRRHNETATSFAKKYGTHPLGGLKALKLYGGSYFSEKEYAECLRFRLSNYYRFLAKNLISMKGTDFFLYHIQELKTLNHPLSYSRLSFATFSEVFNFLFPFKRMIAEFHRRVK